MSPLTSMNYWDVRFEFLQWILIHVNHNCFCLYFLQLVQRAAVFQTLFECCHVKKGKKHQFHPFKCFWRTKQHLYSQAGLSQHFSRLTDHFCALMIKELFHNILSDPHFPPTLTRRMLNNKSCTIFSTVFTPTLCAKECRFSFYIQGTSALTSKC